VNRARFICPSFKGRTLNPRGGKSQWQVKRLTAALLEMVLEEAADVFVSTDEDEGVLLKVAHDQYEPRYVILIKGGFKAVEVRALAS
jgi:hypothetical protein